MYADESVWNTDTSQKRNVSRTNSERGDKVLAWEMKGCYYEDISEKQILREVSADYELEKEENE